MERMAYTKREEKKRGGGWKLTKLPLVPFVICLSSRCAFSLSINFPPPLPCVLLKDCDTMRSRPRPKKRGSNGH